MLEYAGQCEEPGHERRCAALLAALAWTARQSGWTDGADMASVRRDLTQHLARSRRESVDAEALADALASLCLENAPGSQSSTPSSVHVQLASDVLATLNTRLEAGPLLSALNESTTEQLEGQGRGVEELYRSALCAWVAIAPPNDKGRAIVKDRILHMTDGKLDLSDLELSSLPELPAGLITLDARYNQLTDLPPLPEGIRSLGATRNQLTQLPPLPRSLIELDAVHNRLTHLPELPADLVSLDAANNRLAGLPPLPANLNVLSVSVNQLTELPPLPPGLVWLSAYDNRLSRLPVLPASLTSLWAYRNQLTELPPLPASLTVLEVDGNRLSRLPPSILNLARDSEISVEGNRLSPAFLQQLLAATSAPRYSGPRIHFSMGASGMVTEAARPLHESVRDWFSNDEQAQVHQWQMHDEEAHAAEFSRFLDRLKSYAVNNNVDFKMAVAKWLSRLVRDEELRQLVFQTARGATVSCEDRIALTYNNLTKLSDAHAIGRGEYDTRLDEIVERGRGAFRLDALEKIARKKARALSALDEIEVYLAYQVQLRERLKLPTDIANMRYFNVSGVTAQDLENAEQEVLAREQAEFPHYFLVEWEPWQQVLARLDREGTERARQKLRDMLPDYDREVTARLASLGLPDDPETQAQVGVGLMKTRQLAVYEALTREFLRKRGEEALLDRIMARPTGDGASIAQSPRQTGDRPQH
ncbi:hypothetical protein RO07_25265 [Pandoraea pulmonicola]|uniref:NEL domain-containing protein n=1 Tax=Pandoraea pulmonicola TaxID=93221 RepID=A0ABM6FS09_PANPU|nr:hypothetical protein RO07_25265 [Pandoraea pulmonicola]